MATADEKEIMEWRKYLVLLATLVASVTYVAGLNPPAPQAEAELVPHRYTAFFYCNAVAFVASLVVIVFMLDRRISNNPGGFAILRSTLLLDLVALMSAFAAGSCRDLIQTIYISTLFAVLLAYIAFHVIMHRLCMKSADIPRAAEEESRWRKNRRKIMLLLATFATPLTYGAGLAPPGGFPLLHDSFNIRYQAFFYANSSSLVASLTSIVLLTSRSLGGLVLRSYALLVCTFVELLGLIAAFAAGSSRWTPTTVCIISLVGGMMLYFMLQPRNATATATTSTLMIQSNNGEAADKVEQSRSLLLLLATLSATVTYQAGLSPPGGVWPGGHPHHIPGNPVLLDMQPKRYKAFYGCNTAAFVASVVVIVVVLSKEMGSGTLLRHAALNTVIMLDLFGLMGAYVAGSCRDATTTIYVFALAVAVLVISIAKVVAHTAHEQSRLKIWVHYVCTKLDQDDDHLSQDAQERLGRTHRNFFLQLAFLTATLTYQTGLNPPGGFIAGDPVLLHYYRNRYQVFFYCNATAFMASVAVVLLLANESLYLLSIGRVAVNSCVGAMLLGLMGAYAAGSCRKLRTSIYVVALVAAVVTFLILQIILWLCAGRGHWLEWQWLPPCVKDLLKPLPWIGPAVPAVGRRKSKFYLKSKDLMLLAMLGASVTYQAGLAPPGGTLGDDDAAPSPSPSPSPLVVAGNPILLYSNLPRYQAFFYCNATSFVASVAVILLLLQRSMKQRGVPLWAMQTAVVLDQLGLLGAYAAGSCRDWETSAYIIIALVVVVVVVAVLSFDIVVDVYQARTFKAWKYWGAGNEDQVSGNGANV